MKHIKDLDVVFHNLGLKTLQFYLSPNRMQKRATKEVFKNIFGHIGGSFIEIQVCCFTLFWNHQ